MKKQMSLSGLMDELSQARTKKKEFLEQMERLFAQVVEQLKARGLLLKKGTIVDSTLISAPSSTKNAKKERDPEAHSTKKGNNWHFGYKAHIGVDKDTGLVHTLRATAANVHDVTMLPQLLSGEEETVHGDSVKKQFHSLQGAAQTP